MFRKSLILSFALLANFSSLFATPLDDYVKAPDSSYHWEIESHTKTEEAQVFKLHLTSQQWRNAQEVDKPLWTHQLVVVVPTVLKSKTAVLTIGEGSIGCDPTILGFKDFTPLEIALKTHAVACELSLVPNQHLKFADEKDPKYLEKGRAEDSLVAYTWDKYLSTQDPSWPLRLPMTKSVVRGMDATEELVKDKCNLPLDGFILIGKSKRGWTAWTTAATDKRVKAIVPMVIDLLNLKESFTRHYRAYGNWSPAVKDYVAIEVDKRWDEKPFKDLMAIIEPYSYQERFTMPKYIINASGDEFFLPDSSRLYYSKLPGSNLLWYVPNTGHYISEEIYKESVLAYIQILVSGKTIPEYNWELTPQNELIVKTKDKPISATLWQAQNPAGRDFRIYITGKNWQATPLKPSENDEYKIALPTPEKGWGATFVELTFASPEGLHLKVSTDVIVLPDQFPYNAPISSK